MNFNKFRNSYKFKNELGFFFNFYKSIILILLLVLLVGIITGAFTASKYLPGLELGDIPDSALISFIKGNAGSFGLFFSFSVKFAVAFLFIILLNKNSFFAILNGVYIFVLGYTLGFTIASFVSLFSLAGILNVIVIILPFDLMLIFILILISAVSIKKGKILKRFGRLPDCNNNAHINIFFTVLFFGILFIKCMLLPIIRITIIIN